MDPRKAEQSDEAEKKGAERRWSVAKPLDPSKLSGVKSSHREIQLGSTVSGSSSGSSSHLSVHSATLSEGAPQPTLEEKRLFYASTGRPPLTLPPPDTRRRSSSADLSLQLSLFRSQSTPVKNEAGDADPAKLETPSSSERSGSSAPQSGI